MKLVLISFIFNDAKTKLLGILASIEGLGGDSTAHDILGRPYQTSTLIDRHKISDFPYNAAVRVSLNFFPKILLAHIKRPIHAMRTI